MRTHSCLLAVLAGALIALLVAPAARAQGELEKFRIQFGQVIDEIDATSESDERIQAAHKKVMDAEPGKARQRAFQEYRELIATTIAKRNDLLEQLAEAIKLLQAAKDSDEAEGALKAEITKRMDQLEDILTNTEEIAKRGLEAVATAEGNTEAEYVAESLQNQHEQMRYQMQTCIEQLRESLDPGNVGTVAALDPMLRGFQATAALEQQALLFDFEVTTMQAKIEGHVAKVNDLVKQLSEGTSFTDYMLSMGEQQHKRTNNVLNRIAQMDSAGALTPITPADSQRIRKHFEMLKSVRPYRQNGQLFQYDLSKMRWYTWMRVDGKKQKVWCPVDPAFGHGQYVKMHEDGFFYSEAPHYDEPAQLTFAKDWHKEEEAAPDTLK